MENKQTRKFLKLDGSIGEGGGQLVRIASGLAALTGTPLHVVNVRGNRPGKRGGGLKSQHVACIQFLADASSAETTGCSVGSKAFDFKSKLLPADLVNRNIKIKAVSAASSMLVFQAILPFLLFAGDGSGSLISVSIQGGTNVSFSLSFEYLDQVLLPALERFGIYIERQMTKRGWSHGTMEVGHVEFQIKPVPPGQSIKAPEWPLEQGTITKIDVTILVPENLQKPLTASLLFEIGVLFPDIPTEIHLLEDSKHNARIYTLLVAHTSTGLRFGRDWLYDKKTKGKTPHQLATEISQKVVSELDIELQNNGVVDEFLQDQLVVFQALAEGRSSIPRSTSNGGYKTRLDRTEEPFGDGSTHTTTARWVASQLLPQAKWYDNGRVCEGVGWKASPTDFTSAS